MSRPVVQHGSSRLALGTVVCVLLMLSMAPSRWVEWVGWFGNIADKLVIPVQAPVSIGLSWLVGRVSPQEAETPALREAREQAELYRTLYLQSQEENARLSNTIDELTGGLNIQQGLAVTQVPAAVLGDSGDSGSKILKIRAGADMGVSAGDVVTKGGVNLLGRVIPTVDGQFCRVQAITDKAAGGQNIEGRGRITGAIFPGETNPRSAPDVTAERIVCMLAPTGDGKLSGDAAYVGTKPGQAGPQIPIGSVVRLADDRWPATAQMLVLGKVERVEPKSNQRAVVTVTPFFVLNEVREVIVRVAASSRGPGVVGGPGGGPK